MNTYSLPFILARRFRFRLYRLLHLPISSHNAIWYGADPTGIMDSTQAIQNAIDTVGGVDFSGGKYITDSSSVIDDNVSIRGARAEYTTIRAKQRER